MGKKRLVKRLLINYFNTYRTMYIVKIVLNFENLNGQKTFNKHGLNIFNMDGFRFDQ